MKQRVPEVNSIRVPLADGLRSTIIVMRELERVALRESTFIDFVNKHFSRKCGICTLKRVWEYMQKNFIYEEDEVDEVVISPAIMLLKGRGDCDDFALFAHTVFTAMGIESKYILLGSSRDKPTHIAVYAMNKVIDGTNNKWNNIPDKYKYYILV